MPNKLSVRRDRWAIADDLVEDPQEATARDAWRLVVLIHGFNVSEEDAHTAYESMRKNLRSAIGGSERQLGAVWEFHWPGDHPSGSISKLTYPARVHVAQTAGARLVEQWLAKRKKSDSVILIAHSLGCRVALEAVRTVRRMHEQEKPYGGPHIDAVFLLAAAVPVDFCAPGPDQRFVPLLAHPTDPARACTEHVFHSRRDRALKRVFDAGQGAIPEPGNAVGRHGLPGNRWSTHLPTRLRHGKYWGSPTISGEIAELLHLSGTRSLGSEPLPEEHPADDERSLPQRRLSVRRLLSRVL
jgi:pimeloyl-ACP methyl ester carboxylesterase